MSEDIQYQVDEVVIKSLEQMLTELRQDAPDDRLGYVLMTVKYLKQIEKICQVYEAVIGSLETTHRLEVGQLRGAFEGTKELNSNFLNLAISLCRLVPTLPIEEEKKKSFLKRLFS